MEMMGAVGYSVAAAFPPIFSNLPLVVSEGRSAPEYSAVEPETKTMPQQDCRQAGILFSPVSGGSTGDSTTGGAGNAGGMGGNGNRDDDDDDVVRDRAEPFAPDGNNAMAREESKGPPQNYYDDETFYAGYVGMRRKTHSANYHIERPYLKKVLPEVKGRQVLDLGCGTGEYIMDFLLDAAVVDAVDLSRNMLSHLKAKIAEKGLQHVRVINSSIEGFNYPVDHYDLVLCMLAFHYIKDLAPVFAAISRSLRKDGTFIFNVEHPIYTAARKQGWETRAGDAFAHWRMDDYFNRGLRRALWFGVEIERYHRTIEDYFNLLIENGFHVTKVLEPEPSEEVRRLDPELDRHHRRPPFLMFVARKV